MYRARPNMRSEVYELKQLCLGIVVRSKTRSLRKHVLGG